MNKRKDSQNDNLKLEAYLEKFLEDGMATEFLEQLKGRNLKPDQYNSLLKKLSLEYQMKLITLNDLIAESTLKTGEIMSLTKTFEEQKQTISNLMGSQKIEKDSFPDKENQERQNEIDSLKLRLSQCEESLSKSNQQLQYYKQAPGAFTIMHLIDEINLKTTQLQISQNKVKLFEKYTSKLIQDLQLLQTQHKTTFFNYKQLAEKHIQRIEGQIQEQLLLITQQELKLECKSKLIDEFQKQITFISEKGVQVESKLKQQNKIENYRIVQQELKEILSSNLFLIEKISQNKNQICQGQEKTALQKLLTYANYLNKILGNVDKLICEMIQDLQYIDDTQNMAFLSGLNQLIQDEVDKLLNEEKINKGIKPQWGELQLPDIIQYEAQTKSLMKQIHVNVIKKLQKLIAKSEQNIYALGI